MNERERAAYLRALAAVGDFHIARIRLAAAALDAAAAMKAFAAAWQSGIDRELAHHPDLAEWNVQMDGFYDTAT